ncbi:MAG: hypothetical protein ACXWVF_16510 [Telluria sp.]
MPSRNYLVATLFVASSLAIAGPEPELRPHEKITGVYRIYGGGLGDPIPPTPKDAKVMFSVDGKAAKALFERLGPDVKDACTEGTGTRVRAKDQENLMCLRTPDGEYSCNFGFDLRTGKSIGGAVC